MDVEFVQTPETSDGQGILVCYSLQGCKESDMTEWLNSSAFCKYIFLVVICWSWNCNSLVTSCKQVTRLKRPWYWEGLGTGGRRDDRGWDGWMASLTQWPWVWVISGSWWWRLGVLQVIGTRVSGWSDWVTESSCTFLFFYSIFHRSFKF